MNRDEVAEPTASIPKGRTVEGVLLPGKQDEIKSGSIIKRASTTCSITSRIAMTAEYLSPSKAQL